MRVYVLLFNPRTENEGIHTLQIGDRNTVLMFESEDDATRYALMLEAQDFPAPVAEEIDSEEVEAFCNEADYDCKLIPEGELAVPPETNIEDTDWKADQPQQTPATDETEISSDDLDRIRRQLEGLL
ncbi:DUF3110 domain-containing protein [Oxynema sp. CENA135]|jgi:hypothetical protein|uniref:DUF3110 domain-containing protein n=1 Tax=Oxynema aestuarii AP17 TaxID=2064643 RepID=A0A6H1U4J2_9CYAN|nr:MULTISPECIES: DUF3110 domain-containing protein [Oxynema]MBK4731129.1 DUF3110 domain-containing protein [Oxynema sp. CENA135]QIZ73287.1 DUF3110 domain-containing protein [Oxynema aestuarii AP17]RMH77224.1 MAG: DUF3110 domain-containing protein [Cyanobacteria bacterium J007]